MANIYKIAEEIINMPSDDVSELSTILKEEYGILPQTAVDKPDRQYFDFRPKYPESFAHLLLRQQTPPVNELK